MNFFTHPAFLAFGAVLSVCVFFASKKQRYPASIWSILKYTLFYVALMPLPYPFMGFMAFWWWPLPLVFPLNFLMLLGAANLIGSVILFYLVLFGFVFSITHFFVRKKRKPYAFYFYVAIPFWLALLGLGFKAEDISKYINDYRLQLHKENFAVLCPDIKTGISRSEFGSLMKDYQRQAVPLSSAVFNVDELQYLQNVSDDTKNKIKQFFEKNNNFGVYLPVDDCAEHGYGVDKELAVFCFKDNFLSYRKCSKLNGVLKSDISYSISDETISDILENGGVQPDSYRAFAGHEFADLLSAKINVDFTKLDTCATGDLPSIPVNEAQYLSYCLTKNYPFGVRTPGGGFIPFGSVRKGQAAAVIARIFYGDKIKFIDINKYPESSYFHDDKYYYSDLPYIRTLVEQGVIHADSEMDFGPMLPLSPIEAILWLSKINP
jgi:hypothetical protein